MAPPSEIIIDYDDVDYKQETKDFMRNLPRYTKDYIVGLFPILHWIHRYNLVVKCIQRYHCIEMGLLTLLLYSG